MSFYNEDEMQCPKCGHIGLLPDGDFDLECPACGYITSLEEENEECD